jgi:hypothetical protein
MVVDAPKRKDGEDDGCVHCVYHESVLELVTLTANNVSAKHRAHPTRATPSARAILRVLLTRVSKFLEPTRFGASLILARRSCSQTRNRLGTQKLVHGDVPDVSDLGNWITQCY